MNQKLASTFALGILGGIALVLFYQNADQLSPILAAKNSLATSSSPFPPASGALTVSDQPAGESVRIESVTVPPPGVWVAVVELMPDGTLGNVLGAALARGPRSNLSVSLLRATLPGHRYAAVLYRDDGNGNFLLGEDSAYVDFDTGQRVVAPFKTLAQ
jgi:hypothetical protein